MKNPNKYGSVLFLGKNRRKPWAARITKGWNDEGVQQYIYLGYFADRKDALNCLAEYNRQPFDVNSGKLTFLEVYKRWQTEHFKNIRNKRTK